MAFKKPSAPVAVPDSPDRLFRDLPRRKHASLFDHQGQILRTYVAKAVDVPDVALQLPTGSGKTLVGLLLADWRRRKFRERVVYLCPTRQLVNQVAEEANSKYGLTVEPFVGKRKNFSPAAKAAYHNLERVAVAPYSGLFNTNPFFDDPDVVIVDDAHAAENYIASHWTVKISRYAPADETLFKAVVGVLKGALSPTNYGRLTGVARSIDDAIWVDKIPTPQLLGIERELRDAISTNIGDGEQKYPWSIISDNLTGCQLYVSSAEILIRPLIPPTWAHAPFAGAKQRIFMSATLGAGGDLERLTGRSNIMRLPIPEGWDKQGIGRRLFIFPEKSLREDEGRVLRRDLMTRARRSLVLTPSNDMAKAIAEDVGNVLKFPIYDGSDLETGKDSFVASDPAVAVVANRYDGIDFPNDDCRLLFVEGLPRATNLQERFLMARMGANLLFNERVQTRVLQAVGRCTRGLNDYSAVVVTGEDLPAYLTDLRRRKYFHPELQGELEFGIEQSTGVKSADILDNFRIFLEHDTDWEEANEAIIEARDKAVQVAFPAMDELASAVVEEIAWQKAMWDGDHSKAFDHAREVLAKLKHPDLRGYRALWHYLAGSAAELAYRHGDSRLEEAAREQFKRAKESSSGISWLNGLARKGVSPTVEERDQTTTMLQVERLEAYLAKLGTVHNRAFSTKEREIREGLKSGDQFEQAQVLLGQHLGFDAGKREEDASPDPWWHVGDVAIVFEDHANAAGASSVLDATKARQAASHPDWIRMNVPAAAGAKIIPVLVSPVKKAKQGAVPHLGRFSFWSLDDFRAWSDNALDVIRELRRTFTEPGDLAWRADAITALEKARVDGPGLSHWLSERPASKHLMAVP
ncbi:DEAD/DEAH box helicase [Bradyrhizobium vignae]|uniref:DEAD/DEAH box helicase domain protein n=1 Tax=Bradyrhizobium vignae TaxID=1549949 RepID=A0A2U3PUH4_9BRAD|nr:DEAD/DEAH box helicase [Bradyrhizobium vignae]SPP92805.1 DEAD/DEAH box helicase domain protein [Bradyrhizobium vignae]